MSLRRSILRLDQQIRAKRYLHGLWPLCLTCGRPVDSEELVEGEEQVTTFAKVLVKHHGAEELRTFDFGSTNWDDHDLRQFMASADWFDPMHAGDGSDVRANTGEP